MARQFEVFTGNVAPHESETEQPRHPKRPRRDSEAPQSTEIVKNRDQEYEQVTRPDIQQETEKALAGIRALRETNREQCERLVKALGEEGDDRKNIFQKLGERLRECTKEKAEEVRSKFEFLKSDPKSAVLLAAMEFENETLSFADLLVRSGAILPMLDMLGHAMAHGTLLEKARAVGLDLADDAVAFIHKIPLRELKKQGNAQVDKFLELL